MSNKLAEVLLIKQKCMTKSESSKLNRFIVVIIWDVFTLCILYYKQKTEFYKNKNNESNQIITISMHVQHNEMRHNNGFHH